MAAARTNPPGNDELSDTEDDINAVQYSDSAVGKFRSRVLDYRNQAQYPAAPLYHQNEVVYLQVASRS
ncbi:MAG: hypothetical protein MMC33_003922 [Icmadophila ericetorum]|nr:hypothetical protein [Icmadophila ericetorum]